MTGPSDHWKPVRARLAVACRVLAARGLADGFLGHVSERVDDDLVMIRCRGPHEAGLAWTTADDIRLVTMAGAPGAEGELDGWSLPNEFALHAAVLRHHVDGNAVVHAHPEMTVAADLAGVPLLPVIGAFDIPAARLAATGVPVYPRGVLIRTPELASDMVRQMRDKPVIVLRGHGVTSAAATVEEATLNAISLDRLARIVLAARSAGGSPRALPEQDLAALPDLGADFNLGVAWRHELARLGERP